MTLIPNRLNHFGALFLVCAAILSVALWRSNEMERVDRLDWLASPGEESAEPLAGVERETMATPGAVGEPSGPVRFNDDPWSNATVVLRKESPTSTDGTRGRTQRVVVHPEIRYRILVEETWERAASGTVARTIKREVAADHFLLEARPGVSSEALSIALDDLGLDLLGRVSHDGPYQVGVTSPQQSLEAVPSFVAHLNSGAYSNLIEYADYDFVRRIAAAPDDPYYDSGDLWGLDNRGVRSGSVAGVDIESVEGWDIRSDASEIVVAVVDTGVRYTHEDLAENIWVNSDEIAGNGIDDDENGFVDDVHGINAQLSPLLPEGGDPVDENGHGTHVAGTIGAVGNNGLGVTGVAWRTQLMALRFLTGSGVGMDSDAIRCIDYAIQNGADVINSSWGGDGVNRALFDAVERANEAGIIFVAAAGNGRDDIDVDAFTPAGIDLPNVVTVGNHDDGGDLHSTSNFGAGKVDLSAPGTRIRSTLHRSDSSYGYKTGTSMATPYVSGILALVMSEYPEEDFLRHIERVLQGAIGSPGQSSLSRTGARASLAGALRIQDLKPSSPTRFSVSSADADPLLSWDINWAEPVDGFRIEKQVDNGEWKLAGFVGPNERRFADPANGYSSSVRYRLTAVNAIGESLPSQARRLNTLIQSNEPDTIGLPSGDQGIGFGESMDASEDVLVVGAPFDDDAGPESGSVYVYERQAGSRWEYRQKLIGDDSQRYDNFGHSVAVGESAILAGAFNEDSAGTDAGAAYLFERDVNGVWRQSAKLVAEESEGQDRFGFSVAVEDSIAAVSARDDDDSGTNAGAVYVFERNAEGSWRQRAKLVPPDDSANAYFGWSIDLHGDRLAVGAKGDSQAGSSAGAVYLYRKSGVDWNLETRLLPPDPSPYSEFGYSVAIDDGTTLIGSPGVDGTELDSGAAFLYRQDSSQWVLDQEIGAPYEEGGVRFGAGLSLGFGRAAIIGRSDTGGNTAGFVYERNSDGGWALREDLLDDDEPPLFGVSIALAKEVVSVGNPSARRFDSVYDVPDTPENIGIGSISERGVTLSWSPAEQVGSSIVIDRREVGADDWRMIATIDGSSTVFTDESATGGRRWEYRLRRLTGAVSPPTPSVSTEVLPVGRLVNLSVRGFVGRGERVLASGFTVLGSDPLSLGLRARGPHLWEWDIPNPITDPKLTLYPFGGDATGSNDDWFRSYEAAEMLAFESATGAAPIGLYASEAVSLQSVSNGVYSIVVENAAAGDGIGLAEIFEVPEAGRFSDRAALVNLSARGYVGSGSGVLIGGFVIAGDAPARVAIRGVGPGLSEYGVVNTLEDPKIRLHTEDGTEIQSNGQWGTGGQAAELDSLADRLGAFALDWGSEDAALVVTLPPGLYTCVLESESGDSGVGLMEIYLVD